MKKTISRILSALVLTLVSISGWADTDSRVVIDKIQNGTITVGTVAETGEQTVTLTVTPATNYYIETSDIVVRKTVNTSAAPQRRSININIAEPLQVTAAKVDGRGVGTYTFTLPDGYGAYVEATTHACLAISPKVSIAGWTYGATASTPAVTGNTGNGEVAYTYAPKGSTTFSAAIPTNAGEFTVKASVAAAGHYLAGEATATFTISKAAGSISYATKDVTKTFGDAAFINELTKIGDGTVSYASSDTKVATVNASTGEVTIVGSGKVTITATVTDGANYTYASKSATYTLNVNAATMSVNATGYSGIYDGKAHGISVIAPDGVTVKYGTAEGTYTLDASPTYTNAGTYTVYYQVTKANYKTEASSQTVAISKAAASIGYALATVNKTFNDAAFTNELTKTGDGTVSYASSDTKVATVNASTGEVTIVGSGKATITATVADGANYTYETKTASYLLGVDIALMNVTASGYSGIYDGKAYGISVIAPEGATVKYGTAEGTYTLDASPTYTNAGNYIVYYQVTKANYDDVTGSQTVTITAKALTDNMIQTIPIQTATGSELKPAVTVSDGGQMLTEGVDYTVSYANNLDAGTGTVIITGQGNYSGTAQALFTIVADKTELNNALAEAKTYYEGIKDTYPDIANTLKETIDAAQTLADKDDAALNELDSIITALNTAVQTAKDQVGIAVGISQLKTHTGNDVWYDLNGRRLNGRPTQKGMYLNNGKKVMIR